jgi:hypothetical protein
VRAALDAAGRPSAWLHRIVGQSIVAGTVGKRGRGVAVHESFNS